MSYLLRLGSGSVYVSTVGLTTKAKNAHRYLSHETASCAWRNYQRSLVGLSAVPPGFTVNTDTGEILPVNTESPK